MEVACRAGRPILNGGAVRARGQGRVGREDDRLAFRVRQRECTPQEACDGQGASASLCGSPTLRGAGPFGSPWKAPREGTELTLTVTEPDGVTEVADIRYRKATNVDEVFDVNDFEVVVPEDGVPVDESG